MFSKLSQDFHRYVEMDQLTGIKKLMIVTKQEFGAILVYRFGSWVRGLSWPWILKIPFKILAFLLAKTSEMATGILIPFGAEIKEGLYIAHAGSIVIHSQARIGAYCSLGTGVVIGNRSLGSLEAPCLGDHVFVGVGAKILGSVSIGNRAKIGANAVVLQDVPEGATAAGIPACVRERS